MRERWIDSAKGIAILLVIIGHVSGGLQGIWNFQFVYGIHLVVFFILSGYTLKKRQVTADLVNKKFLRLMIPYFYTCAAIMAADAFNSWYLNQDASIATITRIIGRDLLRSFFASGSIQTFGTIDLGTRIGAIWFLPALFFAVLIVQYLLSKIEDRRLLGVSCGLISLSGYILARFIWLPFSIQSGMFASFFVWMGYEIKRHELLSKVTWKHYIIAQIILLLGIYFDLCDVSFVSAYMGDIFLSIPVGLSGCLLIYLISKIPRVDLVFAYIGKISLSVLCAHLFSLETLGVYFDKILNRLALNGNLRIWVNILFQIMFAVFAAVIIEILKKIWRPVHTSLTEKLQNKDNRNRDISIDVAKGFFILAMLLGHFAIDGMLRTIIYSCHMMAFVLFSGYFYHHNRSRLRMVQRMLRSFIIPYIILVVGVLLLNYSSWNLPFFKDTILTYGLGMFFSRRFLTQIPSVGPVYFILMLFATRLIYLEIDHYIKKDLYKWYLVVALSLFGMMLGIAGIWLPWSIDIALYALVFYQLGILLRKYDILQKVRDCHISYFIFTPIWAYMIYCGGMEIAVRNYGQYGLVIVGAIAGTFTVYKLASYITNHMPICREFLRLLGEGSIIVIIIHTLLGGQIGNLVAKRFDGAYMPSLIGQMFLQITIALIIKCSLDCVKKNK